MIRRLIDRYDGLTRAAQAAFAEGTGRELEIWRWANKGADTRGRWHRLENATWRRMKRQAIECAAGL